MRALIITGEVLPDIAPFQAAHVEEGLMQVGLRVHALHGEERVDGAPLRLGCWESIHVHGRLDGETLAEETLGDDVLAIPSFAVLFLSLSYVV